MVGPLIISVVMLDAIATSATYTHRQTERHTDTQTDRHTDTDRQTDTETYILNMVKL